MPRSLKFCDVTLAAFGVGNGVGEVGGATGLVVNTTNVEALITLEEGVTLDSDGGDVAVALHVHVGRGTENGGRAHSKGSCHGGYGCLHDVVGVGKIKRKLNNSWY